MKNHLSQRISCPHCGQHIYITLDASDGDQDYFEDCAACCNPIHFNMHIDYANSKVELHIDSDDEQIF